MANEYRVYINTLIFTLVSCGTLLALLMALLYLPAMVAYTSFCVTVAVGLLVVVACAIIRIAVYQRNMSRKAAILRNNTVVVKTCPDYYTVHNKPNGTVTCENKFTTGDGAATISFPSGPLSIDLSTYDNKTLRDVCEAVDPPNSDAGKTTYNIPWSDMRSLCQGQH